MRRPLTFLALAALSLISLAEPPKPQPPANPPVAPAATLHANAQLVVVDVVVTDKNQRPVPNLKASDFTVVEDNVPQSILNFEDHASAPAAPAAPAETLPPLPPGVFTNYSPLPGSGPVNVLLLDALNTPMQDQAYVHDQLLAYVKQAPPGVRIAIFGLNDRLILLQGFTSDPEVLKSVLEHKTSPSASRKIDDPVAGGDNNPNSVYDTLSSIGGADIAALLESIQLFEAKQESVQLEQRASQTLDAMNAIAHYLGGMPGRKNLIWFSGSFPLTVLPDGSISHPFDVVASSEDEFRETTRLLAASQVAVYPIDARGINQPSSLNVAISGDKVGTTRSVMKSQDKFFSDSTEEHGTMSEMAEETGGRAFYNTNGLAEAVGKAVDAGSNYYTLAYSPTQPRYDGSFRKIQVKLRQAGYTLAYRRGYYADDAKSAPAPAATSANAASAAIAVKTVNLAMARGAPAPTEIVLKVRVLPSARPSEDVLAPGNSLNSRVKEAKGPYRRYVVDVAADPHNFAVLPGADGKYTTGMRLLIFVYDQNGVLIDSAGQTMRNSLPAAAYKQLFAHGVQFHQEVSVPLKGDYYLRIGVHDLNSSRVGALEVPIAYVRNLPPAAAVSSAAVPRK